MTDKKNDDVVYFLKEKDGPRGKFFSKNLGDQEKPNYINGNMNQDGSLTISFQGDKVICEPRRNDYGTYYVAKVMDSTFFVNEGDGKWGKYLRMKEAPPRDEPVDGAAPERRESYGSRS